MAVLWAEAQKCQILCRRCHLKKSGEELVSRELFKAGLNVMHERWPGSKHSDETKDKIGRGTAGARNGQFGTKWMNDGKTNRKVKPEEIESWTAQGWRLGRLAPWLHRQCEL